MVYTAKQIARLSGVSVRTLHYYDEIGLLEPAFVEKNGYRYYGEQEFLKLQQILFFRELDFELSRIKAIFDSPRFDPIQALEDQKNLIELKRERLSRMIKLINKTIKNMKEEKNAKLTEKDLRDSFSERKYEEYKEEAREKWGRENVERSEDIMKGWNKEQYEKIKMEGDAINMELAACIDKDVRSEEVQKAIKKHYDYIIRFYDPSWPLLDIYRGLGKMYVEDERFAAFYKKYHPDMPKFMCEAMEVFCKEREKKS